MRGKHFSKAAYFTPNKYNYFNNGKAYAETIKTRTFNRLAQRKK